MLIAVCVLSPAQLEHVLGLTSFWLRFGGILRGWFVQRIWFDRVPAGTVLAGTEPVQTTRNGVYREHVLRTCSCWNCTENKCERPVIGSYLDGHFAPKLALGLYPKNRKLYVPRYFTIAERQQCPEISLYLPWYKDFSHFLQLLLVWMTLRKWWHDCEWWKCHCVI